MRFAAGFFLVAMTCAASSHAQTQRSGAADARVAQQLQQLTAERSALQAENAKLTQELERMKKELASAASSRAASENRARSLEANATRSQASQEQTAAELEQARSRLQELIDKFRDTATTLRTVETEHAEAKQQLTLKGRELQVCIDRNAGLYNLNTEVLNTLENRGFWSAVAEREPFTRLKRVELENLIDDYKYRADELRLEQERQSAQQAAAGSAE